MTGFRDFSENQGRLNLDEAHDGATMVRRVFGNHSETR